MSDCKKKILFFNSTIAWGGGEKWHFETAKSLASLGFTPYFICGKNSELSKKAQAENFRVYQHELSNLSFLNYFSLRKIKSEILQSRVSVIIANLPIDIKILHNLSLPKRIKVIYRRGSALPIRNSFLNRRIFSKTIDFILANSHITKSMINENKINLFPENKINVIYNGIDVSKYENCALDHPDFKNRKFIIGNLGRLVEQKSQDQLIDLAEILKKKNFNFKIIIGGEGKLYQKLIELAVQKEVSEFVEFVGYVEDVQKFMKNIDIFFLSSKWEGFGYVLVEAMASGKPVIAYDCSSNPEIVENEQSGCLFPFGENEKIAEKIVRLSQNEQLYMSLAEEGRKRVLKKFTKEKSIEKLLEFLALVNS